MTAKGNPTPADRHTVPVPARLIKARRQARRAWAEFQLMSTIAFWSLGSALLIFTGFGYALVAIIIATVFVFAIRTHD